MREIGPTTRDAFVRVADQHVEQRDAVLVGAALVQEFEQIDQIGRRPNHGAAIVAVAHLGAAEKVRQRRNHVGRGPIRRRRSGVRRGVLRRVRPQRPADPGQRQPGLPSLLMVADQQGGDGFGLPGGAPVQRAQARGLFGRRARRAGHEGVLAQPRDVERAPERAPVSGPNAEGGLECDRVRAHPKQALHAVQAGGRLSPRRRIVHARKQRVRVLGYEIGYAIAGEVERSGTHRPGERVRGQLRHEPGRLVRHGRDVTRDHGGRLRGRQHARDLGRGAPGGRLCVLALARGRAGLRNCVRDRVRAELKR